MSRYSKDNEGTNLSFTPAHDGRSEQGAPPDHVDGQRWHDGVRDEGYGKENPETHWVGQSPGYGQSTADIPVRSGGTSSSQPRGTSSPAPTRDPGEFTDALLRRRR